MILRAELFDLDHLNQEFETCSPQDILAWSWAHFQPDIAASSSFQTQSVPLLHMIAQVCPAMPVFFLDTGYHFPETLAFRDALQTWFGLDVQNIYSDPESKQHLENQVEPLYLRDPDLCCRIHKVEPMKRAMAGLAAWVTGVRRDQTAQRKSRRVIERREDGLVRIHPMLNWTQRDMWAYVDRYNLPVHPLFSQGYTSIGCAPCTRPVYDNEDERAGRWSGSDKTECGLHAATPISEQEDKNDK